MRNSESSSTRTLLLLAVRRRRGDDGGAAWRRLLFEQRDGAVEVLEDVKLRHEAADVLLRQVRLQPIAELADVVLQLQRPLPAATRTTPLHAQHRCTPPRIYTPRNIDSRVVNRIIKQAAFIINNDDHRPQAFLR